MKIVCVALAMTFIVLVSRFALHESPSLVELVILSFVMFNYLESNKDK